MAKVFLLNPPHPEGKGFTREGRCTQESGAWATQWPPLSLATAAAWLDQDGHRCRVLDCPAARMNPAALAAVLKDAQPEWVFWSTATPTIEHDLALAARIKALLPTAVTGVLGTHVTALPDQALQYPGLDLVVRREPEATIRELCRRPRSDWPEIQGLSFKHPAGASIRHNSDRDWLAPHEIPAPAWQHLDIRAYRLPLQGRPFLMVAPIRGCPFACNFCTAPLYYGKKLRQRPVDLVLDEIEANISRHKVRDFFVWADTFTADRRYVIEFCRRIKARGLDIAWTCNSRVDTIDREMLAQMKAAGLWMISFGLESGSDRILKMSGKNIRVAQSVQAVSMAHVAGLKVSGHFIFGLPGETTATLRQTLDLSLRLPLDIAQYYAAAPFPGTGLYARGIENGSIDPAAVISQSRAAMALPGLPAARIDRFRRYAFFRFYLRPRVLAGLLGMASPAAAGPALAGLKRFVRWSLA